MNSDFIHCVEWSADHGGKHHYRIATLRQVLDSNNRDRNAGSRSSWKIIYASEDRAEVLKALEAYYPPIKEKEED